MRLPPDLAKQVDEVGEYMDFKSREEFVEAAVRRLIDYYRKLIPRHGLALIQPLRK